MQKSECIVCLLLTQTHTKKKEGVLFFLINAVLHFYLAWPLKANCRSCFSQALLFVSKCHMHVIEKWYLVWNLKVKNESM